jgi:hypothetical protein
MSGIALLLNKAYPFERVPWGQGFELQDRGDQLSRLPKGQQRSPFLSRFWVRTRKWWAKRHSVI